MCVTITLLVLEVRVRGQAESKSKVETRSVGPRSSFEDSFLTSCEVRMMLLMAVLQMKLVMKCQLLVLCFMFPGLSESVFIIVLLFNDRYLHFYEKINHFGQDPDVRDDPADGDETKSRRKTVSAVSTVSFFYNYQQHSMTGTHLATTVYCLLLLVQYLPLCVSAFDVDLKEYGSQVL